MAEESNNPTKLKEIAELLIRHGVKFIVIGGQAEYIFGSPRVTFDVDLCYERSPENLNRMAAALAELNVKLRNVPDHVKVPLDARALAMGSNYTFATPLGSLDILGYVEPIGDYAAVDRAASTWRINGQDLRVIDLEDLIKIKRHINRPKDQSSLFQLLAIKRIREETGQR